jgi:diacylglycerol kinase
MNNSDKFSIRKRIKSFSYAFNGIINLIKSEHNARIQLIAMLFVVLLGILFKINISEWISIAIVVGLVFIAELFNTAIEKLSDIVSPEWNKKIGNIKDYSAAAVLISAIISLIVGCLIFIPRLLEIITTK